MDKGMTVHDAAKVLIAENRELVSELNDQISAAEVRLRTQRYANMLESQRLEDEKPCGNPWLRDDAVEMIWMCRRCNELETVQPSFIAEYGIPLCGCVDDAADMQYMGLRAKRLGLFSFE